MEFFKRHKLLCFMVASMIVGFGWGVISRPGCPKCPAPPPEKECPVCPVLHETKTKPELTTQQKLEEIRRTLNDR